MKKLIEFTKNWKHRNLLHVVGGFLIGFTFNLSYREGYHFDIMIEKEVDFGANENTPKNPRHTFAGYYQETPIIDEEEII